MQTQTNPRADNRQRLSEIMAVIRRHEIVKGVTPEKLCGVIEDLGPTFIKLGQILSMRSDILPKEYCQALTRLRSSVAPMPFEQVKRLVEDAYGRPLEEVFSSFSPETLGSASIAQAHAAVLHTGEHVVVKVQREGIHDTMSRDIMLLKQACRLLKYTPINDLVDFQQVLDEMWITAQEEMNFQTEAANLERFRLLNQDEAFIASPLLYRDYTTTRILVMERIDGFAIDDMEALRKAGLKPSEIGERLADNYVKQIMDDGFFHADPHPGNLRVQDGKIVWLDMGMMGSLTERERRLIVKALTGAARGDVGACRDAALGIGEFRGQVDKHKLYRDIEALLDRYADADLGSMDLTEVLDGATALMRENNIAMPAGMTMLARGLATLEGVVAALSPELNVMRILTARLGKKALKDVDWQALLKRDADALYESAHKSLKIPSLLADILHGAVRGQINIGVEQQPSVEMTSLLRDSVFLVCLSLLCAALLLCGALTLNAALALGRFPWCGLLCFVLAAVMLVYILRQRVRQKRP